ncbi:MAG: hypothetical protein IPM25_01465 [Chloracidobacterium sp.]|nr:hypothetical protein [Chloracidobacterium sp.]
MKNFCTNEDEIAAIVRSFEEATVARGDWKHADHLVVALCYVMNHDLETAVAKIKGGLFKLLEAFKVDLTKEMPYHETLTAFWMRTVADFNASKNGTPLVEKVNELVAKYDKDYPLRFYSRDFLFSDEARARFVEPDLARPDPQAEIK